jgi:hypothetical protein
MTFGVDQCMRCGKPITVRRDTGNANDFLPSKMSEAEWRAAGYLARPNRLQQRRQAIGCCTDCMEKLHRKNWKPGLRLLLMLAAIVLVGSLGWWLLMIFKP